MGTLQGDRATETGIRLADPGLLDRAVAELREIERRSGIERTLAIGKLILTQFFGGNPKAWRDRRRNKNNSVRRLADRRDCPFCRSALNEAVAIYVAVSQLPCVQTFGHISASHVACVLKLPEGQREAMLTSAEQERWSVRELRKKVTSQRRVYGERRGRPSADEEARATSKLKAALVDLERATDELAALSSLRSASRATLREAAGELEQRTVDLRVLAGCGPNVTLRRVPVSVTAERSVRAEEEYEDACG